MDAWIEFARGPLFRMSMVVLVLGLGYRLAVTVLQIVAAWHRAGDRRLPVADIVLATIQWLLPKRLFRQRPIYSLSSVLFHIAMILMPVLFAGHVTLLGRWLPGWWPVLPGAWADALAVAGMISLLVLVAGRIGVRAARQLSRVGDVAVLLILVLLFGSGLLASHPVWSPFPGRSMVLAHILLGNLVLVMIPLTKITHCVLYPLTQLVFQLGWHFPAETGRHVATVLAKENEPV